MSRALTLGAALEPLVMVRRNLDVVPGGGETSQLAERFRAGHGSMDAAVEAMARAFAPLAEDYDLIVFDCPPGDDVLGRLGLALSRALVVPVKMDAGSLDGLELMAGRYAAITASGINPHLELLGIALFDVGLQATALRRQLVDEIRTDFGGDVRVFDTAIRHSQRAAFDMRREGLTALEYETVAAEHQRLRLELLRHGAGALRDAGPARSASASGLATDYVSLSNEVLARSSSCRTSRQWGWRRDDRSRSSTCRVPPQGWMRSRRLRLEGLRLPEALEVPADGDATVRRTPAKRNRAKSTQRQPATKRSDREMVRVHTTLSPEVVGALDRTMPKRTTRTHTEVSGCPRS